jgi:hypothetical protein
VPELHQPEAQVAEMRRRRIDPHQPRRTTSPASAVARDDSRSTLRNQPRPAPSSYRCSRR